MATVNSPTAPDLFSAYGPQEKAKKSNEDVENRFLALLVAQMNNQDPLNPLDNAEVTSQMAQIHTVKGIEQLNQTVQMLNGRMQSTESMAALGAVGRLALTEGASITLYEGQAAAGFVLPQNVDTLTVKILDAAGNVLHTANLGEQGTGIHTFVWDGMTDNGQAAVNNTYKFEIEASANGKKVDVAPLSIGRIDGVIPNQDEVIFDIAGKPTALDDIVQFL
jgi:flagellar basal-body rod modification protein FlgD